MANPTVASKPHASVSWPSEGIKVSGDWEDLGPGKKCRITVEGVVTGFSAQDWGCSVDLKPTMVYVEGVNHAEPDEDEGRSMADIVKNMGKKGQ